MMRPRRLVLTLVLMWLGASIYSIISPAPIDSHQPGVHIGIVSQTRQLEAPVHNSNIELSIEESSAFVEVSRAAMEPLKLHPVSSRKIDTEASHVSSSAKLLEYTMVTSSLPSDINLSPPQQLQTSNPTQLRTNATYQYSIPQAAHCIQVTYDDGFAVVVNTGIENNANSSPVSALFRGDLCAAKRRCRAFTTCSGFEWRPVSQEAELFLSMPPRALWRAWKHDSGSMKATPSPGTAASQRSFHGKRGGRRNLFALISPALQKQLQKARARAHAVASKGQQQASKAGMIGPSLYIKVESEGTLEQLLRRFDERPRLQVRLSAVDPPLTTGVRLLSSTSTKRTANLPPPVCSGLDLPGHPRALFDVFRVGGELQFRQGHTIDGGLCAVKAACATLATCEGFLFGARDGSGVLGNRFTVKRLGKPLNSRKTPLGSYLYIRRPHSLNAYDGNSFVSGQLRKSASTIGLRSEGGGVDISQDHGKESAGYGCIDAEPAGPFQRDGSVMFTDPMRKRGDVEVVLAEKSGGGFVEAFSSSQTTTTNPWQLSLPQRQELSSKAPVWISMTTLPGRIARIKETVFSLLNQSVSPNEIIINLPLRSDREGTGYTIPSWLQDLLNSESGIRLRRIESDYGPATKLIPSVIEAKQKGENVLVLVVDDDTVYPPRLLETLLAWNKRLPDAILAFSGWPVHYGLKYPHWTENYLVYGNELFAPHPVSVIRGNTGYLVQTRFFDSSLWEGYTDAPPGAFYMDDVWISGRLAANRVRRFVVPFDEDSFTTTPSELGNVMTLDSVALKTPRLVEQLLHQQHQEQAFVGSSANSEDPLTSSSARALLVKHMPSTRSKANSQALNHFEAHWDVLWDGRNFSVFPPSHKQS